MGLTSNMESEVMLEGASFMCNWNSFTKFGIKKSHEIISHIFDSMALPSI
jgi:hypothetical protein